MCCIVACISYVADYMLFVKATSMQTDGEPGKIRSGSLPLRRRGAAARLSPSNNNYYYHYYHYHHYIIMFTMITIATVIVIVLVIVIAIVIVIVIVIRSALSFLLHCNTGVLQCTVSALLYAKCPSSAVPQIRKDHHNLLHCSPLLNKARVRRIMLDQ